MKKDTVGALRQPGSFWDEPLTDILLSGVHQLLAQAIEAEVTADISAHKNLTDDEGRRIVPHGYSPEREIQTGIGAVRVKAPLECATATQMPGWPHSFHVVGPVALSAPSQVGR